MFDITLITMGKLKEKYLKDGINEYLKKDDLFIWDWENKGDCVKTLVLR